jgi:UDP-N-acetylmuramoyl-tripeptide--D-alanyl-D-alanine ligase
MKLPLAKVAEFTSATGDFDRQEVAQAYSIDSRTIQPGELFFAVKGERLEGHDYVEKALENGAVAAVVRRDQLSRYSFKGKLLAVEDTLLALQRLASAVRRVWGKSAIGITGSVGKTTTKDAIAHLLSAKHRVHSSKGNFNNHFGLPLGLLKLQPEHEIAIIEMGMSHAGEIAALARIAHPDEGVITSVAPVHLENFDSIAGIADAKFELVAALPPRGTAFLNADDEHVSQFGRDFQGKVVSFGMNPTADVQAENIQLLGGDGSRFELVANGMRQSVSSPLLGRHNIYNVLAALAVALNHDISMSEIASVLPNLEVADKRGQVLHFGNITVINDCYNSSPKALMAATETLSLMPGKRHIAIAGEMLELGSSAEQLHRECGRYMAEKKLDFLLGVRGLAKPMVEAAREAGMQADFVATPEEAGHWLAREAHDGDTVLLKASRGVKLERALEKWKECSKKIVDF